MTAKRLVLVGLILALPLSTWIVLGKEGDLETRFGMGFMALLRKNKHYYLGLEGRLEAPITETVGMLAELGVTNGITNPKKNHDIELIDGVLIFGFPSRTMKAYLGVGTGFYRHDKRGGWTKYGFYTTLVGGIKTNTFFVQGKTTTTRMNPVVSIGVLF